MPGKEGFPESSSRSAKLTQLPATEYAGFLWLALDQQTSARCEMRQVLAPGTETDDRIVGLSKAIDAAEASDDSWSWLVLRRIHALHHEHEPAQSLLGECLKDARILGLESEIGHLLRPAKVLQGGGQDDHRPPSAVPSMPTRQGRQMLELSILGGGPPVASVVKRQMLRSYADNAIPYLQPSERCFGWTRGHRSM